MLLADLPEHEFRAGIGEAENLCHRGTKPAEDRLPDGHAEHKDREEELQADTPRDDPPADRAPVTRERDTDAQDQNETEDSCESGAE